MIVWRLNRWGRSLADLVTPLQELTQLGIGFISLNEALDLTTLAGRAMVGMLSVFAEYEEVYRTECRDLADARRQIRRFTDGVYNKKRLHSVLGYNSPVEFEQGLQCHSEQLLCQA